MDRIITKDRSFIDEHGRERIFYGLNVCDKEHFGTGKTDYSYSPDEFPFEQFADLGFNIIRLGFTWSVIEPQPRVYNNKFLTSVERFLDKCKEHGIYAFLDMHQDLYSHHCFGDGAPRWATLTDPYVPFKPAFVWAEPYFYGRACHKAFDNFWDNKKVNGIGLQDYFADTWKHIANRFKDHPALFGFDLLNEPFPGSSAMKISKKVVSQVVKVTLKDKRIKKSEMISEVLGKEKPRALDQYTAEIMAELIPGPVKEIQEFDTQKYMPFLNKTAKAIREVTDNGIIFIENSYFSNIGMPCSNTPITIDGKQEPNQCFSPHAYDIMVDTPAYKYANNSRVGYLFDEHRKTQDRMDLPVLVGEWGGNAEGTEWLPHVEFLLQKFDEYKWGHTYWAYYDGILEKPVTTVLSRPYPKAVTGVIDSYKLDKDAKTFTLKFTQDKAYKVPTVIYSPFECVSVQTDGKYEIKPVGNAFEIHVTTKKGDNTITIEYK